MPDKGHREGDDDFWSFARDFFGMRKNSFGGYTSVGQPSMNGDPLRMKALELAVMGAQTIWTKDEVLQVAEAYYQFMRGSLAAGKPEQSGMSTKG